MTSLTEQPDTMHVSALDDLRASLVAKIWQPRFASHEDVALAASMLPARPDKWAGEEGPRPTITVTPGSISVRALDFSKADRTEERAQQARQALADMAATYLKRDDEVPERIPSRVITGWSSKSRCRMVERFAELDYQPMFADPLRVPAMITLTYPGDWLTVAPDGQTIKGHLAAFRKRYERAWRESLYAMWKLEFQQRGAPHFHLFLVPPHGHARIPGPKARRDERVGAGLPFKQWLSATWADIVDHPDPEQRRAHEGAGTGIDYQEGLKASDPRRVCAYFTKHGAWAAKDYQNCVPEEWQEPGKGPGRFWGYWTVKPLRSSLEVSDATKVWATRFLRRWASAQQPLRDVQAPRVKGGRPVSKYGDVIGLAGAQLIHSRRINRRKIRRRAKRFKYGTGFVCVNDGPAMATQLARALDGVSGETRAASASRQRSHYYTGRKM